MRTSNIPRSDSNSYIKMNRLRYNKNIKTQTWQPSNSAKKIVFKDIYTIFKNLLLSKYR